MTTSPWVELLRPFDFTDNKEYIAEQEKAIKHFAIVIENATDEKIKTSSIQGIVQYLCFRGRYDEAKKYAELYPENLSVSKDSVLLDCLQGREKIIHCQKMLEGMLTDILNHIGNYGCNLLLAFYVGLLADMKRKICVKIFYLNGAAIGFFG